MNHRASRKLQTQYGILAVALLWIGVAIPAASQITVSVPDASVSGLPKTIALDISGQLPAADSARLHFTYGASRMAVRSILGGDGRLLGCSPPAFTTTDEESKGNLVVRCGDIRAGAGTLMTLIVEILAGKDAAISVTPDSIIVDGVAQQFEGKSGRITVSGATVSQVLKEGIEQNSPNPFNLQTNFHYTLDKDSPVRFQIYSVTGRLIREIAPFLQTRGKHRFYLDIDPGELGAGSYYLAMTTDQGTYISHLLCLK